MKTFTRTIEINALPDRVYQFLADPRNLLTIWPNMVSVSNVAGGAGTGRMPNFEWTFKLAGFPFAGLAKVEQDEPAKRVRYRNESGIPSTFLWTYEGLDGARTRLTLAVEYAVPTMILGRIAESLAVKINERDTEAMLANLKEATESAQRDSVARVR